jgi:hypothetical protein
VLGMNMPAKVMRWRQHLTDGTTWEQALTLARTDA